MRLTEEVLLLVVDPATGRLRRYGPPLNLALAGAVVHEALAANLLRLQPDGRLTAVPDRPLPDDALLRLAVVHTRRGAPVQRVVGRMARGLRHVVVDALVARGVLQPAPARFGVFVLGRWKPAAGTDPAADARGHLREAATRGGDPRGAQLLALFDAIRSVRVVLPDLDRRSARQVGARFRATDRVAQGVRAALRRRENVG